MSSSRGAVPTPSDALAVLEAPVLRWLYTRRRPQQSFTIAFDAEIARTYDEWDALGRRVAAGTAAATDVAVHARSVGTAAGPLPGTPDPFPYRLLSSVVDVTTDDPQQIARILADADPEHPLADLAEAEPRLSRARHWVQRHLPEADRTLVRGTPDRELLGSLTPDERAGLDLLLAELGDHLSLAELTRVVYGVPKRLAGLDWDAAATAELKVAQRAFFALLYRLLVGRDTGPRLPTLLLALGRDRVVALVSAPSD